MAPKVGATYIDQRRAWVGRVCANPACAQAFVTQAPWQKWCCRSCLEKARRDEARRGRAAVGGA